MAYVRKKDANWRIGTNSDGTTTHGDAELATLMDLRDELKQIGQCLQSLNSLFHCRNFTRLPANVAAIRKNTECKKPGPKKK